MKKKSPGHSFSSMLICSRRLLPLAAPESFTVHSYQAINISSDNFSPKSVPWSVNVLIFDDTSKQESYTYLRHDNSPIWSALYSTGKHWISGNIRESEKY